MTNTNLCDLLNIISHDLKVLVTKLSENGRNNLLKFRHNCETTDEKKKKLHVFLLMSDS